MKRGGFVKRRTRLAPVSARVKRERPEFERVLREVRARSGGRCEVSFATIWQAPDVRLVQRLAPDGLWWRCTRRASEGHHTRKPRRAWHDARWIIDVCRECHNRATASYRVGRLRTTPRGDGTFDCEISTKESKWA